MIDKRQIAESTIKEVRKIRELEEKRIMMERMDIINDVRKFNSDTRGRLSMEMVHFFETFEDLQAKIIESGIHPKYKEMLEHLFRRINEYRDRIVHGEINQTTFNRFFLDSKEISYILDKILHDEDTPPELMMGISDYTERLRRLSQRFQRFM